MSYSILYSDIFRFRTNDYLNVSYTDGLSLDDQSEYFTKIRIGQLLENLLLYDSVYIESPEVPVAIRFLNNQDALLDTVEKGYLRLLNTQKHPIVKSIKQGYFYTLASGNMPLSHLSLKDENDLEELLHSPGWPGDFSRIAKPLYKTMQNIPETLNQQIIKGIENDFHTPEFRHSFQLTSKSPKQFLKKESVKVDRLLEVYYRTSIAEKIGIESIFIDDVLLNVIETKMENFVDSKDYYYKKGLYKIFDTYEIPNIPMLYANGEIDLEDILILKDTDGYKVFIEWLRGEVEVTERDSKLLTRELINEIVKRTKNESANRIVKPLKIVGSIYAGYKLSPEVGAAITLIDNLLIDRFLTRKTPQIFLDDYVALVERNRNKK